VCLTLTLSHSRSLSCLSCSLDHPLSLVLPLFVSLQPRRHRWWLSTCHVHKRPTMGFSLPFSCSLSFALSLSRSLVLSLSRSLALSLSQSLALALEHFVSCPQTTDGFSLSHTHTLSLTHTPSQSFALLLSRSPSLSLPCSLSVSLSRSLALSLSRSLALSLARSRALFPLSVSLTIKVLRDALANGKMTLSKMMQSSVMTRGCCLYQR